MYTNQMKKTYAMSLRQVLLSLIVAIFITPSIVHAELYRWVDENGVVHYGDRIPAKYAKIKRDVLNDQGQVVKTLAAEKTAQELAAEAAELVKQAELQKQATLQTERKRALLASYSDLTDIDDAHEQKRYQLNKQIELLDVNTENLKQQQQGILNRIKVINAGNEENKKIQLERQNSQLADTHKNIDEILQKRIKLEAEIDQLNEFYAKEKQDFTNLINEKKISSEEKLNL